MRAERGVAAFQRRIYWRSRRLSLHLLILVTILALAGLYAVERLRVRKEQPYYTEKLAASTVAERAMQAIRARRLELGIPVDTTLDPTGSGLLGAMWTPVTTEMGQLAAKRTSIDPNFAAVVVQMLKKAGARKGQLVAVGYSGSFPALNLCVLAAVQTLGLEPIVISSCGASQWGANEPGFLWIDMERYLHEKGLIRFQSVAASIGGDGDRGLGMDPRGRREIVAAIHRLGLHFIDEPDYALSVDRRMEIYREHAGDRPIRFYVNVGGGASSLGRGAGQREFPAGVVTRPPPGLGARSSVIMRFLTEEHATVLDLRDVEDLARRYGLPVMPKTMPQVGEGGVYEREGFSDWLAAGVLAALLLLIWGLRRG